MHKATKISNTLLTALLTVLSLAWIYPVLMILLNSLKKESAITTSSAFQLPNGDTFAGLENYINAIDSKGFLAAFGYTLLITVTSVALILIFCSMCAWFITRVNTWWSKACYYLFIFSMVVPFQMLMFTLSATADKIGSSLTLGNLADALGITVSKSTTMIAWWFSGRNRTLLILVSLWVTLRGSCPDFCKSVRVHAKSSTDSR